MIMNCLPYDHEFSTLIILQLTNDLMNNSFMDWFLFKVDSNHFDEVMTIILSVVIIFIMRTLFSSKSIMFFSI